MAADQTGTNPINFQPELRFYNDYSLLNTNGDGSQNLTTVEYRTPIGSGKWQFRTRVPLYKSISADLNDDGINNLDATGLGDIDFRFLTVPYMDMSKRQAVAVGVEVFTNTASDPALGYRDIPQKKTLFRANG